MCFIPGGARTKFESGRRPRLGARSASGKPAWTNSSAVCPAGVRAREASPNQPRRGCGGTMLPLVSYSFELAPIRLRPMSYAETRRADTSAREPLACKRLGGRVEACRGCEWHDEDKEYVILASSSGVGISSLLSQCHTTLQQNRKAAST